jgi:hypothetical protein
MDWEKKNLERKLMSSFLSLIPYCKTLGTVAKREGMRRQIRGES